MHTRNNLWKFQFNQSLSTECEHKVFHAVYVLYCERNVSGKQSLKVSSESDIAIISKRLKETLKFFHISCCFNIPELVLSKFLTALWVLICLLAVISSPLPPVKLLYPLLFASLGLGLNLGRLYILKKRRTTENRKQAPTLISFGRTYFVQQSFWPIYNRTNHEINGFNMVQVRCSLNDLEPKA